MDSENVSVKNIFPGRAQYNHFNAYLFRPFRALLYTDPFTQGVALPARQDLF